MTDELPLKSQRQPKKHHIPCIFLTKNFHCSSCVMVLYTLLWEVNETEQEVKIIYRRTCGNIESAKKVMYKIFLLCMAYSFPHEKAWTVVTSQSAFTFASCVNSKQYIKVPLVVTADVKFSKLKNYLFSLVIRFSDLHIH